MKKSLLFGLAVLATTLVQTQNTFPSSGNVGVGTTNPVSPYGKTLHVHNPTSSGASIHITDLSTGAGQIGGTELLHYSNNSWWVNREDGHHIIYGGRGEKMRINNIGNVGIGLTNPSEKLTVKGKVLCEEVEVVLDAAAPDYVFEKYYTGKSALKADYVMPTLSEVEAFTKANNHLPEVPSAKTLKEDGLELKNMSLLLLQKVEELTLYTIEQEKRIILQEMRIKTLEAKLTDKK